MKCLNCGSIEMFYVSMSQYFRHYECGGVTTNPIESIRSVACASCGHVELFSSEEMIASYKERKRKNEIVEKQRKEIEEEQKPIRLEVDKLKIEILELKKFVEDDNNTVKQVKEGKEKRRGVRTQISNAGV